MGDGRRAVDDDRWALFGGHVGGGGRWVLVGGGGRSAAVAWQRERMFCVTISGGYYCRYCSIFCLRWDFSWDLKVFREGDCLMKSGSLL